MMSDRKNRSTIAGINKSLIRTNNAIFALDANQQKVCMWPAFGSYDMNCKLSSWKKVDMCILAYSTFK